MNIIFYRGKSLIDGSPIVGIASGCFDLSRNTKTGPMIQTWIMRSDVHPHEATQTGEDESVCGDCRQRHHLGGGCYVLTWREAAAVWQTLPEAVPVDKLPKRSVARLERAKTAFGIRVGAYGDPSAIPAEAWLSFLGTASHTAYTHHWKDPRAQWLRGMAMASVESVWDARRAQAMGWKTYRISATGAPVRGLGETVCLYQTRAGTQCVSCLLCDGRRSIVAKAHGALQKVASSFEVTA
jgi:hypothetical protein